MTPATAITIITDLIMKRCFAVNSGAMAYATENAMTGFKCVQKSIVIALNML